MNGVTTPYNDSARIASLHEYGLLDTPSEAEYDAIVALAAAIAGVPIAAISLVDADRQWFKARLGVGDLRQTARSVSFCAHAIDSREPLLVPDATLDPRFANNPLVTGEPHIRFYLGMPLINAAGHALGTLCIIDRRPRQLGEREHDLLRKLTTLLVSLLEDRRASREMARLTDYFEQLADDVYLFDADSRRLIYASSRVLARFGTGLNTRSLNPATLTFAEIDEWQGLAEIRLRFDDLSDANGASLRYESDVLHPCGGQSAAEVTLTRISGRSGDTLCAVVRDRSGRHADRRARETVNVGLEQQVALHTRDLSATLDQLQSMAGTVAHDLRAPLHAVLGFATIVAHDPATSEKNRAYLSRLEKAARHMQGMVEQLVADLRDVAHPMFTEYLDLDLLTRDVWSELAARYDIRNAELRIAQLPPARGDMLLVRRVIDNLLSNALKYARPVGRLTIEITGESRGELNAYFVRDNGIGFTPEQAGRLFTPFMRLHADRGVDGLGLGLTSVAHSVGRHGGRAWAQADPEGGALFGFSLPAHKPDRRAVADDAESSPRR